MKRKPLQDLITRADIAQLLGVSKRWVADNERRLGLAGCRVNLTPRSVRYRQLDALKALNTLGVR